MFIFFPSGAPFPCHLEHRVKISCRRSTRGSSQASLLKQPGSSQQSCIAHIMTGVDQLRTACSRFRHSPSFLYFSNSCSKERILSGEWAGWDGSLLLSLRWKYISCSLKHNRQFQFAQIKSLQCLVCCIKANRRKNKSLVASYTPVWSAVAMAAELLLYLGSTCALTHFAWLHHASSLEYFALCLRSFTKACASLSPFRVPRSFRMSLPKREEMICISWRYSGTTIVHFSQKINTKSLSCQTKFHCSLPSCQQRSCLDASEQGFYNRIFIVYHDKKMLRP